MLMMVYKVTTVAGVKERWFIGSSTDEAEAREAMFNAVRDGADYAYIKQIGGGYVASLGHKDLYRQSPLNRPLNDLASLPSILVSDQESPT